MVIIKRIGVGSTGKVFGGLYALLGFIFGLIISLISLIGGSLGGMGGASAIFGLGAIITIPIMYGIMGFISGAIMAFLYNLIAGWIGGIEVETE